ncbi:MAG: DNA translocase FtsK [Saprospiraceae bacterium]|nr:DNA translocase FtsK [Saprospiraceae bacterium]
MNQLKTALGLFLMLTGIFLIVAFISYIFTWKADQDKVFQASWKYLFNLKGDAENMLGNLGAMLSHQFFYNLFGIASFFIPVFMLLSGINLFFKRNIFPLKKFALYTAFLTLFLALVLGFFLSNSDFSWAGAFGAITNDWLNAIIGKLGTAILLFFALIAGLIFIFNVDPFNWVITQKEREAKLAVEEQEHIKMEQATNTNELVDVPVNQSVELDEEEEIDEEGPTDFELITKPSRAETPKEDLSDTELELETVVPEVPSQTTVPEEQVNLDVEKVVEEKQVKHYTVDSEYDPKLDLSNFQFPTLELLDDHGSTNVQIDREELENNKNQIVETLRNYKIEISKIKATVGPTVTLYEIVPAPGVRISKIKNLEDDIALSLAALGIRIIAPIPGRGTIGIEVPNQHKNIVSMKSMIGSEKFVNTKAALPIAVGKTISNENYIADLAKMPHLLIAGATGQGKSVGINSIIVSLLYKMHPAELKFVLIDPKKVELSIYRNIEKHYLAKLPGEDEAIITDTKKVINTLNALCIEMDDRYNLLKEAQCRNIKEYNKKFKARKLNPEKGHRFLPYIVLVIDEFADLIMTAGKEVEGPIARLAQLARAIGIHLIIATQRPSVNIITGIIKANFPARIAFRVMSKIDSRTILDMGGADQLIGRGDLILSIGSDAVRLQCPFVDTPEVDSIIQHISAQTSYPEAFLLPEYSGDDEGGKKEFSKNDVDSMFEEAARLVVSMQSGSTSMIQRKLQLGYNRAGRIMDQLEAAGIVGPARGSKPREVLFMDEVELEHFLQNIK